MLLQNLEKRGLINPPTWLTSNTQYLTRMGSMAYGVASSDSDQDIYGVCIPPRDYIFPPNYIEGFDNRDLTFHHWEKHHVPDPSANGGKGCNYDFSIHSIVDYFHLCVKNNPNIIDSLFVDRESIIHSTPSWEIIRDNRQEFLHKGIAYKLKSYAYSQLSKARNSIGFLQPILNFEKENGIPQSTTYEQAISGTYQVNKTDPHDYGTYGGHSDYIKLWEEGLKKTTRFENQKIHGQDNKFLYHIYRLADQAEYILTHHDLDLQERGRVEKMKAIRKGEVPFNDIVKQFGEAESRISNLYNTSELRSHPDVRKIRALLVNCLEHHYGSLEKYLKTADAAVIAVNEIKEVLRKYGQ